MLDFPCWALGSLLSVYVQENKFKGGKIRDAWRMCIDDEWSQGAERYSIRGCSLILSLWFYMYFPHFLCNSFHLNHVLFLKTMGSHILLSILFCK